MTHEERARALMETWWAMPSQGSTKEQWLGMLAAAFAQVEAEAKREMVARRDLRCPHGQPEFGICAPCALGENIDATDGPIQQIAPGGIMAKLMAVSEPTPDPGIPNPKLCAVCGKSPCQSFIACAVRLSKTFYGIPRTHYIDLAVNRDVKIECAYQVGIVSNLPDLHPLPKFTVPNLVVESASAALKKLLPEPGPMTQANVDAVKAEVAWAICTCGAASCGSRLHSSWCDAA